MDNSSHYTHKDVKEFLKSRDEVYTQVYDYMMNASSNGLYLYVAKIVFTGYMRSTTFNSQLEDLKKSHEREIVDLHYTYKKEISSLLDKLTDCRKQFINKDSHDN